MSTLLRVRPALGHASRLLSRPTPGYIQHYMSIRTAIAANTYSLGQSLRHSSSKAKTAPPAYDAQAITVLEGLEPVRKRPGMYIGNTGAGGLNHLVFEVVDNSIDEALAGHCTAVDITLRADGSVQVRDDGRGIPCEVHPTTGRSTLETVLCVLHAGGKFGGDDSGYKISGGLHGVGVSVVNALSMSLEAEVCRDGSHHRMSFHQGRPLGPMTTEPLRPEGGNKTEAGLTSTDGEGAMVKGTRITFKPDPSIFKSTVYFDFDKISARVDELAYLNPGLTLRVTDAREEGPVTREFHHTGGISELVESLCEPRGGAASCLHPQVPVIDIKQSGDASDSMNSKSNSINKTPDEAVSGVDVEVALRWTSDYYGETMVGFANGIRTNDGGTHIEGLRSAIGKTLNAIAKKTGKVKEGSSAIPGEFLREGLTAVVSVKVPEPEFEGQTKSRLGNPEIRGTVFAAVRQQLSDLLEWNPDIATAIIRKGLSAQNASNAAKAARDIVRTKSSLQSKSILPGKLADCSSNDPSECEVFVVEGDSAAGSAKQGRDRRTQAILPLRGKVLNIEKTSSAKIHANAELQALIAALGLASGGKEASYNLSKLRYHRIVIMTDADVDGSHIRVLLLTFLYRYQRKLVDEGHVYIACPPLYKISGKGKQQQDTYFYTQEELDDYLCGIPVDQHPALQRFKGLGEMMPEQLWNTTMNPARRRMKKITVKDAKACDKMFSTLMGANASLRKAFIIDNSTTVDAANLDV